MDNLFSYLKWRGDLTFLESSFNEVDNAILCAFSYIRLEKFMSEKDIVSIGELYPKYLKSDKKKSILLQNQNTLFFLLHNSKRFKDVKVTKFIKETSDIQEKQFCAMTFILNEQEIFVAFRGTDESLTGWKENFNLSYMDTPSQKRAVEYIEDILSHTTKDIIIGGHSKGGNMAMYAYVFCKEEEKGKIKQVYNNDGPGLSKAILDENILKKIEKNIITLLPKSSIIGNLFENDSSLKIIETNSFGILEHDLYTWKTESDAFVSTKNFDKKTQELCLFLNEKINAIPNAKKKKIIDFIYEILESFGVSDLDEIINKIGKNNTLLKKYSISVDDMQIVWNILPLIIEIFKKLS